MSLEQKCAAGVFEGRFLGEKRVQRDPGRCWRQGVWLTTLPPEGCVFSLLPQRVLSAQVALCRDLPILSSKSPSVPRLGSLTWGKTLFN